MCVHEYINVVHTYYLLKNIYNNNNNNHLTAPEEMSTWQERPGSYPTDCRRAPWKIHMRFKTHYIRTVFYIVIYYIILHKRTRKTRKMEDVMYSNIRNNPSSRKIRFYCYYITTAEIKYLATIINALRFIMCSVRRQQRQRWWWRFPWEVFDPTRK